MKTNFQIVFLVAVGVYLYLARALPDSAINGPPDSPDGARISGLSTRLSRAAALAVSLGLTGVFVALVIYDRTLAPYISMMIVAISLWAAVDSHRIGLRRYKTRLAAVNPIVLFNVMYLLWPVLFPWYLVVCSRIGDGTLSRKDDRTV